MYTAPFYIYKKERLHYHRRFGGGQRGGREVTRISLEPPLGFDQVDWMSGIRFAHKLQCEQRQ